MAAKKVQSTVAYNRCALKASGLKRFDPDLLQRLKKLRDGGFGCKMSGKTLGEIAELRREIKKLKGK